MISLLTDFGTTDYFVAAMKGVILSLNAQAQLVDLTHEIPAHDVHTGAFTLGACWRDFPVGTIHLAVIDPGVGSARRMIIVVADGHYFVGPDNGLFSFVCAQAREMRVFHITRSDLFRHPVSATFHGRDVFAPVAAHLSLDMPPEQMGPEIRDYQRFDLPAPFLNEAGNLNASIIHIDRFGNCVTSLTLHELPLNAIRPDTHLVAETCLVRHFGTHYTQTSSEPIAYPGSAGYWEIALWQASLAARYGLRRGSLVEARELRLRV